MTDRTVVCVHCHREVECCAFCEDEHCDSCICYRCLMAELRETYSYLADGD